MTAYIGWRSDSHYFVNDTVSTYYGSFDGSYWCRDSWEYTLSSKPMWLLEKEKLITIGSFTDLDQADSAEITVSISIQGGSAIDYTFTVELLCSNHRPCDIRRK